MILTVSKKLESLINWLNNEYPCKTNVRVYEINSITGDEIQYFSNGIPYFSEKFRFHNGVALYKDCLCEIHIPSIELFLSTFRLSDNKKKRNAEIESLSDYLLESFVHEYYHHLQYCANKEINEQEAEEWCKVVYKKYIEAKYPSNDTHLSSPIRK